MKLHKREIYTDRCCLHEIAIIAATPDWKASHHRPQYPTSGTNLRAPADTAGRNDSVVMQQPSSNPVIRYFTVKTFHMEPRSSGDQLYMSYDPMTGIRTAAILGLFMLTVMGYILYKGRFNRTRWTSKDRLFIEVYKKKLQERRHPARPAAADIRTAVRELMLRPEFSLVPDLTATWVKSHPTNGTDGTTPQATAAVSDPQAAGRPMKTSREAVTVQKSSSNGQTCRQDSDGGHSGCHNGSIAALQGVTSGTLHHFIHINQGPVPRIELVAASQNPHDCRHDVRAVEGRKRHSIPSIVLRDRPFMYDTQPAVVKFSRIIQPNLKHEYSDLQPTV